MIFILSFQQNPIEYINYACLELQHCCTTTCPTNVHVLHKTPGIFIRIIHLNTGKPMSTIKSTQYKDLVVIHCHRWPCPWRVQRCDWLPLMGLCVVPFRKVKVMISASVSSSKSIQVVVDSY